MEPDVRLLACVFPRHTRFTVHDQADLQVPVLSGSRNPDETASVGHRALDGFQEMRAAPHTPHSRCTDQGSA